MMKWKARKETMNIGTLELGNLVFNEDYMELSLDIFDMSDELKEKVAEAIEIAKINYSIQHDELNKEREGKRKYNTEWSDEPVVMDLLYLKIVLNADKPIDYCIKVGFHDAVDDSMEQWNCDITVDLSGYEEELKKSVIKVLIDKFF